MFKINRGLTIAKANKLDKNGLNLTDKRLTNL